MIAQKEYSKKVHARIRSERMAVDIIACVHELFYDRGVEIVMFRNTLVDRKPSEVLELHQYAKSMRVSMLKIYLIRSMTPKRMINHSYQLS